MSALVPLAVVSAGYLFFRPLVSALTGWRGAATDAARAARRARKGERDAKLKVTKLIEREEAARNKSKSQPVPPGSRPEIPQEFPVNLEKPPAPPEPAKADTLDKLGSEKPTKKVAAERLYAYVSREIHEGRSSNLGTADRPNAQVAAGQRDMGNLKVDGIYGDKTRARGKELTGKPWPPRKSASQPVPAARPALPPPPLPAGPAPTAPVSQRPAAPPPAAPREELPIIVAPPRRTPEQAANDLFTYATRAARLPQSQWAAAFGTGSAGNGTVKEAQADMGELLADGIYGPVTRKRGQALIGKAFPPRPKAA